MTWSRYRGLAGFVAVLIGACAHGGKSASLPATKWSPEPAPIALAAAVAELEQGQPGLRAALGCRHSADERAAWHVAGPPRPAGGARAWLEDRVEEEAQAWLAGWRDAWTQRGLAAPSDPVEIEAWVKARGGGVLAARVAARPLAGTSRAARPQVGTLLDPDHVARGARSVQQGDGGPALAALYVGDVDLAADVRLDRWELVQLPEREQPGFTWVLMFGDESAADAWARAADARHRAACTEAYCDAGIPVGVAMEGTRVALVRGVGGAWQDALLAGALAASTGGTPPGGTWQRDVADGGRWDVVARAARAPARLHGRKVEVTAAGLVLELPEGAWTLRPPPRRNVLVEVRGRGAVTAWAWPREPGATVLQQAEARVGAPALRWVAAGPGAWATRWRGKEFVAAARGGWLVLVECVGGVTGVRVAEPGTSS